MEISNREGSLNKAQYARGFQILEQFRKSYPRATKLVMEIYNIPKTWVAEQIWKDNIRWQRFKFCVKTLCILLYAATTDEIQELTVFERRGGSRVYQEWLKIIATVGKKITYCPSLRAIVKVSFPEIGKKYPILLEKRTPAP